MDESLTLIRMRTFHQAAIAFGDALLKSSVAGLVTISDDVRLAAFELFRKYDEGRELYRLHEFCLDETIEA